MKYFLGLFLLILTAGTAKAQYIESYTTEKLLQRISNNDTLYVVNFWATWCGPCVKELPQFDKLSMAYAGKPFKVLLVSLDFKEAYPYKILAFAKKKKLHHEVVWFSETDANVFIPKIDNRWQGSIPATLIVRGKTKYKNFFEGMITASQLRPVLDKQMAIE